MGYKWSGPMAPYGKLTDDRRMFTAGTIEHRPTPVHLSYKPISGGVGHEGSIVVGSVDHIDLSTNPILGSGRWLSPEDEPAVKPAMAKAKMGVLGLSLDFSQMAASVQDAHDGRPYINVSSGKVGGATLVPMPAFDDELRIHTEEDGLPMSMTASAWTIEWVDDDDLKREDINMPETPQRESIVVSAAASGWQQPLTTTYDQEFGLPDGLVAGGGPLAPPKMAFEKPDLPPGTILPWISPDGRFFTYVAPKDVCHTGFEDTCVLSPKSKTNYQRFHQGSVMTQEGELLKVGTVSLGGGHANPQLGLIPAVAHYDDSSTAIAIGRAGEDENGTYMAGALIPGVTDEQVAAFRRHPLSGDWRYYAPVDNLELIAALCVNTPGFPQAYVASGQQMSLIASYPITEMPGELAVEEPVIEIPTVEIVDDSQEERRAHLAAFYAADQSARAHQLEALRNGE